MQKGVLHAREFSGALVLFGEEPDYPCHDRNSSGAFPLVSFIHGPD
jgi:hypothetical protein